ncbi:MAG: GAF domain-containing protein [Spirulina sp.]
MSQPPDKHTNVEEKLAAIAQTLALLDRAIDGEEYDTILHEIWRSITLTMGEFFNADRTTIFLLDEEQDELWSIVATDTRGKPIQVYIPVGKGIAGEVAQYKQVINIPYDCYDDPRSAEAKQFDRKNNYRTYSILALPLVKELEEREATDLIAVVQLINKLTPNCNPYSSLSDRISRDGFTRDDLIVFENFDPYICPIIDSFRSLYKAVQKKQREKRLSEKIIALNQSNLDLDVILKTVVEAAKKLTNCDRSALWLVDRENDELWTKIPLFNSQMKELRIPINMGFLGRVVESGELLDIGFDFYDSPDSETAQQIEPKNGYRTCSLLCMPVYNANDELIGVTQSINKTRQGDYPEYDRSTWPKAPEKWKISFNRSDLEVMKAFNIQAGIALQNAILFNTLL